MDKLLELLGVQKLDEQEQDKIKEKLQALVEVKAQELLEDKLKEEKEKLIEEYEERFENYKEDITGKFSNFVDEILEQEIQIPEKVLEYARKGELYADLIEQFKVRLGVDEGLLDEEVKALLKEAKEEIVQLRDQLNDAISEKLEVKQDATELAAELYLHRKAKGLTENQKDHVLEMLDGVTDREDIDRKFDIIVEAYNGNGKNGEDEEDEDEDEDEKKKKKKKKNGDDEDMDEGKGKIDADDDLNEDKDKDKLDEEDSPFAAHLNSYVKVLKEGKV